MAMKQNALSYITTLCAFNKLNSIISSNSCIKGHIRDITKHISETIEVNKSKKVWENRHQ